MFVAGGVTSTVTAIWTRTSEVFVYDVAGKTWDASYPASPAGAHIGAKMFNLDPYAPEMLLLGYTDASDSQTR